MKDFTIVRKGFDTTEVDSYIVDLENTLEKKEKELQEYRSKESAINRSVIDAQIMADSILAKAKEDAAHIRADVTAELGELRKEAMTLRTNLTQFQESYNRLLRRYLYTGHCEDMTQIFDRLEKVMGELGYKEGEVPPLPEVQSEPQEDASDRVLSETQKLNLHAIKEADEKYNLDEISNALIDSKL